jgi:hypothetical protein
MTAPSIAPIAMPTQYVVWTTANTRPTTSCEVARCSSDGPPAGMCA